ncbi:MAG: hypothetical protein WBV11_04695 [Salegentibacter sp.]
MRNVFIVLSILLIPLTGVAQKGDSAERFEITPDGFTEHVIREYPGKTDSELYNGVLRWAAYTIANDESARKSDVKDQYLVYRTFVPQGISLENKGETLTWDVLFDVAFRFQNQKIRYDITIVEISSPKAPTFAYKGGPMQWSFFDENGNPKENTRKAREQINNIANDFIRGVSAYINSPRNEDSH